MNFSSVLKGVILSLFVSMLVGCFDLKQKFKEEDFVGALKMFCQRPDFSGSPLKTNSFMLYYNKENGLGNIGYYIYSTWSGDEKIAEAHLYENDDATVLDESIMFIFEQLDSDETLHVSIDRKTLAVTMDFKSVNCHTITDEELAKKKQELVEAHEQYIEEQEKANII